MKNILSFIILIHGLIHLMGFLKAFGFGEFEQLSIPITKTTGIYWLLTCALFVLSVVFYQLKIPQWYLVAMVAVAISTVVITLSWKDARFGMIPNGIILVACLFAFASHSYKSVYLRDVRFVETNSLLNNNILTEEDIQPLPAAVQNYIRLTGSVGKPKVHNFKAEFEGKIRKNQQSEWMKFNCEQHNFMAIPTRLFFMNARMKGLPVVGYHHYKNGKAVMDIRLLSFLKVQYAEGKEMNISETVTIFNDMCFMAPASLIDHRIKWTEASENTVKGLFTNKDITISAVLHFNRKGELINFVSNDRFAYSDKGTMTRIPWQTPVKAYKSINGYYLPSCSEVVYNYPQGNFCYGIFRLKNIAYNTHAN